MAGDALVRPNVWKVIATKNHRTFFKKFVGDKPRESGAIDFGKKLQELGYTNVNIVSARKPFTKPLNVQVPRGLLWCPYCLKIREFIFKGLSHPDGSHTPALWRCPVCHISIRDAAVRTNNDFLTIVSMDPRLQDRKRKTPTEKTIRRTMAGRR